MIKAIEKNKSVDENVGFFFFVEILKNRISDRIYGKRRVLSIFLFN